MTVQFPQRGVMDEAKRKRLAQERVDRMASAWRLIGGWLDAQDDPKAGLCALAEALDSHCDKRVGQAFTASLFGRHARSYKPDARAVAESEMARVFGPSDGLKITRLQHFRGGRG